MDNGSATQKYIEASGRDILSVPAVLDSVITDYIAWDIDILLIPGDLTKDGEKQSHLDLRDKLHRLTERGVKIFVIPGNHDINMPNSVGYKGENSFAVNNISPDEFKAIYADFGYAKPLKEDSASLSYVSEIGSDTWLLAIDACRYKEYTTHSISSGKIQQETEKWILSVLKEAREKNIKVLAMMHHGLLEHIIYQDMLFPQYLVDEWKRLSNLFADNGLKVIFTGHSHANDISELSTPTGNKLYDIETGALCSYPFPYRFISLADNRMDISTRNIYSITKKPQLANDNKMLLKNLVARMATQKIQGHIPDVSKELLTRITDIVGEIFLLHVAGDESVSEELKSKIEKLAITMDMPIDLSPEYFQLDYPPADNNLNIRF